MSVRLHTHTFKGVTVHVDGHLHLFSGETSASPDTPGHTHSVTGRTTAAGNHAHSYALVTRPQTAVAPGKHYHYFKGSTMTEDGHAHPMSATTSVLGE